MKGDNVLDVSKHQSVIDWDKVNGHTDGVIIRCGYGDDIPEQDDKQFTRNVGECIRLGIPFGIYLYSYSECMEQTESEISHTLRLCSQYKEKMSYPLYIDLEQDGTQDGVVERAKVWLEKMKSEGFTVGVYANQYWFDTYLKGELDDYSKWVARYSDKKPDTITGQFDAWQYTSSGVVDGINGRVDMSVFYRDFPSEMHPVAVRPNGNNNATVEKLEHANPNVCLRAFSNGKWWDEVCNGEWAGKGNNVPIINMALGVDWGSVKYRVHTKDGRWHAFVTGYNIEDFNNGYAGDNVHAIDAIEAVFLTPEGYKYKYLYMQVSVVGIDDYFSVQIDNIKNDKMDGYCGVFGRDIDKIKAWAS